MTTWKAPDGKSQVIDTTKGEGRIEPDTEDSAAIDFAVAFVICAVTGTVCLLVLRWAGLL